MHTPPPTSSYRGARAIPMTAREPTPRPGTDADWVVKLLAVMRRLDPAAGVRGLTELEEVWDYFTTTVPDAFDIRAGALCRKRSGGAWLVAQCFITTEDELACESAGRPFARIFRTLAFDDGLTALFGDKDLIVFTLPSRPGSTACAYSVAPNQPRRRK